MSGALSLTPNVGVPKWKINTRQKSPTGVKRCIEINNRSYYNIKQGNYDDLIVQNKQDSHQELDQTIKNCGREEQRHRAFAPAEYHLQIEFRGYVRKQLQLPTKTA